jgi:Spy/CpxP family protein refolding chaperone
MKSYKALIAALALGVAASAPLAHAQQKKGGMTPEQQIERIEQAVGSLSAEQKTKINAIIAKGREEMQAIPKEERKEKGAAMQKKQREEIRGVLTADQKAKYDAAMPAGGGKKKKDQ